MANCDEGYSCSVCGEYVENIKVSELYLRYVLGAVPGDELLREPECHIRCMTEIAQFIVDPAFPPVACVDAAADKSALPAEVRERNERLFTKAWRRLQELADSPVPVEEYPFKPGEV